MTNEGSIFLQLCVVAFAVSLLDLDIGESIGVFILAGGWQVKA